MGTTGALTGAPRAPKGGAKDATPPEGEGNPAEGGSSRVTTNHALRNKNSRYVENIHFMGEVNRLSLQKYSFLVE